MDNQVDYSPHVSSSADAPHRNHKITLPLVALGLDLGPVLLIILSSLRIGNAVFVLLFILAPAAGLITGTVALTRGKKRLGLAGMIIAIVAVALPLAFVALIISFFIGAATGMITLM